MGESEIDGLAEVGNPVSPPDLVGAQRVGRTQDERWRELYPIQLLDEGLRVAVGEREIQDDHPDSRRRQQASRETEAGRLQNLEPLVAQQSRQALANGTVVLDDEDGFTLLRR